MLTSLSASQRQREVCYILSILSYNHVVYPKFASEYNEDLTPRKSQKKGQRLF